MSSERMIHSPTHRVINFQAESFSYTKHDECGKEEETGE